MYRPKIKKIGQDYHIEMSLKNRSFDTQRGCYINARKVNGSISNEQDAIRIDIEPDKKPVRIFIDGKEYTGSGAVIIL